MEKIRLYLDVDGVLNPFRAPILHPDYQTYEYVDESHGYPRTFQLHLSKESGKELYELEKIGFEIIWLTTWADKANEFIVPRIGFHEIRVLPMLHRRMSDYGILSKFNAIEEEFDGKPFVWIDDDLEDWKIDFGAEARTLHPESLAICTDPAIGLIDKHFAAIRTWKESLS